MKLLQSLVKKIRHLQRDRLDDASRRAMDRMLKWQQSLNRALPKAAQNLHARATWRDRALRKASRIIQSPPPRRKSQKGERPYVVLLLAVVSISGTMGQRFYNQPQLAVDKRSPQTIHSPADASVVDLESTEEKREAARTGASPVLMIDREVNQKIKQDLNRVLARGRDLRQRAGEFPFFPSWILSTEAQRYLRKAEEWEWQSILASVRSIEQQDPLWTDDAFPKANKLLEAEGGTLGAVQQKVLAELNRYRQGNDDAQFSQLVNTINLAREQYSKAEAALSLAAPTELVSFDASLLDLAQTEWVTLETKLEQTATSILTQGIPPGLPKSIQREAVKLQLEDSLSPEAQVLASKILMAVLQPNLVQDAVQTKLQAEQAVQAVKPVVVKATRGEIIVRRGELIDREQFVLLDHFNLSQRGFNWVGLIGFSGIITGFVGVFWLVERRFNPTLRQRDRLLVLLLVLSVPLVISLGVPYSNLPAVGLLLGSFYGSGIGLTVVGLLSALLPISTGISWPHLLASAAGGGLAAALAERLRSREEMALLGGAVGLSEGAVHLLLSLIVSAAAGTVWSAALGAAALHALAGLAWSIIALGVSPYLEHLFDLVTPVRLAELSNPNRSLLKRLAAEAPGTFQHTLFVATLAETTARTLGCNVELVRAGTLYHDIGKMHDASAFIENQMGGPNKHDAINNPWKSAEIIKKHVTEGLVMARKCRLPKALQAFIPEHQGTMLIAYFYHQAKQNADRYPDRTVQEQAFRYAGPIPQSRETGIVMLADSCEAALRSLKDATPEMALSTVKKILRARWQDEQLVDSGLSRPEMDIIAEVFVRVWQQLNHQRIPYPSLALKSPSSDNNISNSPGASVN